MSEKTNTDLMDVLESLKRIVADEEEGLKEVAISENKGTLILTPNLEVTDSGLDDETQRNKKLEAKISQTEKTSTDTDYPREPGSAAKEDYTNNLVTGVPLEEMLDTKNRNLSGDDLGEIDTGNLIGDKGEADDFKERGTEVGSFSNLSIGYEGLKPMVAEIIQKELQGVLGERITTNIRSLVRREIELAINKLLRDQSG